MTAPRVLISSTPITLGLEDDQNFSKLPQRNRDLHTWAMSIHPERPTAETAAECLAALQASTPAQPGPLGDYPLGDKPLIVISTGNQLPAYARLQSQLLRLSRNTRQRIAGNSSHMVIIDQPELVTAAIREVAAAVRDGKSLHRTN